MRAAQAARWPLILLCAAVAACSESPADTGVPTDTTETNEEPLSPDTDVLPDGGVPAALARWNTARTATGLAPATRDETLTAGCLDHVRYMAAQKQVVHDQDPDDPAHTEAGAAAGLNANIAGGVTDLDDAMQRWLGSLYQRLPLLEPGVTAVGMAFEDGYACVDMFSGWEQVPDHASVRYPAPEQEDVPTTLLDPGPIDPLPTELPRPTGPIITLTLDPARVVAPGFEAVVVSGATGEQLPAFVRLPHDPTDPYAAFHLNTIAIVPLQPLAPDAPWQVVMKGTVDEEYFETSWAFRTKPSD
jgi:hypothetical protein